jgi:Ser/Thr protein kinase RdoA (MazF antagonist)
MLLGQLHQYGTTTAPAEFQKLPWSWWAPIDHVTSRIQTLLEAVSFMPAEWPELVDTCQAIFQESSRLRGFPETMIHGDPWTGNAIAPTPTESILIDWEYSGRGLAVLDLACLLSDCFGYPDRPAQVDEASIASVMDGYTRYRNLPTVELDVLPVAIRFGAAFRTAIRLHLAQDTGWEDSIRRWLIHEQARIAISDQIASRAQAMTTS